MHIIHMALMKHASDYATLIGPTGYGLNENVILKSIDESINLTEIYENIEFEHLDKL